MGAGSQIARGEGAVVARNVVPAKRIRRRARMPKLKWVCVACAQIIGSRGVQREFLLGRPRQSWPGCAGSRGARRAMERGSPFFRRYVDARKQFLRRAE